MATVEEDDIIEDEHLDEILAFPPEIQEAIDQVVTKFCAEVRICIQRNKCVNSEIVFTLKSISSASARYIYMPEKQR